MSQRSESSSFPEILTLEQAAEMLQVSLRTMQRLAKDGKLPGRQIGSQWRMDREQLREWVRGHDVTPPTTMTQEELVERERARLGVDLPETLLDLQRLAAERMAERERRGKSEGDGVSGVE